MVRVRISGDDARKDENGIAHVSWGEAQRLAATGIAEILQGDEEGDDGRAASDDDFEKMTRAELDALAAERGVDISDARTKADVIDALRA